MISQTRLAPHRRTLFVTAALTACVCLAGCAASTSDRMVERSPLIAPERPSLDADVFTENFGTTVPALTTVDPDRSDIDAR